MSRSPEEIERDIEATRASLVATVGEIERREKPALVRIEGRSGTA